MPQLKTVVRSGFFVFLALWTGGDALAADDSFPNDKDWWAAYCVQALQDGTDAFKAASEMMQASPFKEIAEEALESSIKLSRGGNAGIPISEEKKAKLKDNVKMMEDSLKKAGVPVPSDIKDEVRAIQVTQQYGVQVTNDRNRARMANLQHYLNQRKASFPTIDGNQRISAAMAQAHKDTEAAAVEGMKGSRNPTSSFAHCLLSSCSAASESGSGLQMNLCLEQKCGAYMSETRRRTMQCNVIEEMLQIPQVPVLSAEQFQKALQQRLNAR